MIHRRVRGLSLLHCGVQLMFALVLFWIVALCQFGPSNLGDSPGRYISYSFLIGAAFLLHLVRTSVHGEDLLNIDYFRCFQITLRQLFHIVTPLLVFLVAMKDIYISRIFLFSYLTLLSLVLFVTNRHMPRLIARACFQGRRQQRTLICGIPDDLLQISPWLERKTAFGMQVLGYITLREQPEARANGIMWEALAHLESLIAQERINQVVLTRTIGVRELQSLSARCEAAGSRLFVVHDLEQQLGRPLSFIRDDGLHFIALREEPLECPINRLIKRGLDIALSLPVVLFVLPFTSAAVWLAHLLQSPGPLFFRQKRTGLHNEEFWIFKYRTMHTGHGQETLQARQGDVRVFSLGAVMRKLSIDELPQFLNVLKGEMSIVGPRPHLFEHDALFAKVAQFYRVRALIKPGITGLAQVRGFRGETRTDEHVRARLQSDLHYLENWSPMLDLFIIFRTAWQMVRPPRSAY